MLNPSIKTLILTSSLLLSNLALGTIHKGKLIYQSQLSTPDSVNNWKMEGPGKITFNNGWLQMYSPNEEMHHVFWCPIEFPNSFIAEWEVQNLKFDAGLVIVFFLPRKASQAKIFFSNNLTNAMVLLINIP